MKFSLLFFAILIFTVMPSLAKKHILYVGTYTKGTTDGIFVYSFNDHSGKLQDMKMPVASNNPSFLTISKNRQHLYAVNELADPEQNQSGSVSSFSIDKKGALKQQNQVLTYGAHPCHVSLSPDGKKLVASNYTGGSISMFNVLPDGSLSEMVQRIQHEGHSSFKGRQDAPHCHSAKFDAAGKNLFVADLGIDALTIYQMGSDKQLIVNDPGTIKMANGSGPRHFVFSTDGNFIYVINELSSTITALIKYGGVWKEIQTISTLPKDFKGESWCADIHISDNGKFVYGSNRGHNSISVFSRDIKSGKLELIQTIPVEGNWPRNFTLDPTGRFLLVANERSNDITVFKIDEPTGKLKYTGIKVQNQSPVCLQFLN
ncbi:MAG: lactonase family protein [Methylococcaceae bacterium]